MTEQHDTPAHRLMAASDEIRRGSLARAQEIVLSVLDDLRAALPAEDRAKTEQFADHSEWRRQLLLLGEGSK